MNYINLNGKILSEDTPALLVSNRGYRYGDGLFETIKVVNENIQLGHFHFERLFSGLSMLQMKAPAFITPEILIENILDLCKKNSCNSLARVRLSVFRGNGGMYDDDDDTPQYVIECWPLPQRMPSINESGLVIDIFPHVLKSCDRYANLKSASSLCYVQAACYASANKLNDCLVLNTYNNVADSTIANVFMIKDGKLKTPALHQGCVSGVMRKWLIQKLTEKDFSIEEDVVSQLDLQEADELFLTNAIIGLKWVARLGDKSYTNTLSRIIFKDIMETID
ncbi:MAG: aminotransferase class IV [Chitinophagaceae bacterium]